VQIVADDCNQRVEIEGRVELHFTIAERHGLVRFASRGAAWRLYRLARRGRLSDQRWQQPSLQCRAVQCLFEVENRADVEFAQPQGARRTDRQDQLRLRDPIDDLVEAVGVSTKI
jgi:hypothetical protein